MKKIFLILTAVIMLAGCVKPVQSGNANDKEKEYMKKAAEELVDIFWNIDYRTYTPEKMTAFAKEYYDSGFLSEYLSDIMLNSGVYAMKEEKFVSEVKNVKYMGEGEETLGEETFKTAIIRAEIKIISYKPVYPEDSFFEEGKTYPLIFTLYFKHENGKLKLSVFSYDPENEPFLPKRANNKKLTEKDINKTEEIMKKYCELIYSFDYKSYDKNAVYSFIKNNTDPEYMEFEGFSPEYFSDFEKDIKACRAKSVIESYKVLYVDENKSIVNMLAGAQFYYLASAELKIKITALEEFFEKMQIEKSGALTKKIVFGFDFKEGKPAVMFTESE